MNAVRSIAGVRDFADYIPPPPLVGIYFLFREGELVYIGQSGDIARRLLSHASSRFGVKFDHVFWIDVPEVDRLAYEGALVRALNPTQSWRVSPNKSRDVEILGALGVAPDESRAYEKRLAERGAEFGRRRRISIAKLKAARARDDKKKKGSRR